MNKNVALQMYTVRDLAKVDFTGTMEKVAKIGYPGVELAGFSDLPADEMRQLLNGFGLKAVGAHIDARLIANDLDKICEYSQEIGCKSIIFSYNKLETKDELLRLADFCDKTGAKLAEMGLQFCYHNHNHEFEPFDGQAALDVLYANTDPSCLKAEIDTYWVQYAGFDPAVYIAKYPGRCPLLHMKDMESGKERFFAEIGLGIIDFVPIIQKALQGGTEWFVIEQDLCRRDPLESAQISYSNMMKLLAAIA